MLITTKTKQLRPFNLYCFFIELAGIIMTPTRELALQIYRECKKFCKPLNLRVVCVYGGTGISEQVRGDLASENVSHCFLSPIRDRLV